LTHISFTPFPKLTTERLVLRQLKLEDDNEIFALRSDKQVNKYLDRPRTNTIEDARKFINKINEGVAHDEWIYWAITQKNSDKLIGTICLWKISQEHSKAEIGFELLPHYQGKGIMQEVLITIIRYGFKNMKLKLIEGDVSPHNSKSINLLKRNGFVYDRKLKNTAIYTLKNFDYKPQISPQQR
jgi:ribosomal-protein-alanine N-acetyltransferase